MELKNRTLSNFAELVETGECKKFRGRLKTGIDLGTANTVLAVVDRNNRPIAGISAPSHAIQDGVIVNYYESVQLVTKLKNELEEKLGTELTYGAAAIPPGVSEGSVKSIGYVLEGAGFEVTNIVDEPTAAAAVLKITDGAVVDVGGGTTGISILKDGKVIYTDDEATGGSHMTMTVAGHYKIPYEEAEILKTTPEKEDEKTETRVETPGGCLHGGHCGGRMLRGLRSSGNAVFRKRRKGIRKGGDHGDPDHGAAPLRKRIFRGDLDRRGGRRRNGL